jgi:type I restriction enzyme S subunit
MATDGPITTVAGWPTVSLADITTKIGSGATPRGGSETYLSTRLNYAFIRSQNVFDRRFDRGDLAFITDEQAGGLRGVVLQPGDVLLNITGDGVTFARACLVPNDVLPACVNQHVAIIRGDPRRADPGYLLSFLTHPDVKPYIASFNSGGSRRAVTKGHIESFRLPLPSLEEQRGIAGVLSALDDKIESNRHCTELGLRLLDSFASAFAITPAGGVPLGELVEVSRETANPANYGNTLVDHFSIPAFDDEMWPERVAASTIMSNKLLVRRPSILVSRLNPRFNRTWWCVPEPGVPALASTEFLVVSSSDAAELGAIWLAVRDEYFRAELTRRVTGTSGSHQRIRPDDALAIEVPDTRQMSSRRKSSALSLLMLIHQRRNESVRLARLRDALLPELLSGRVHAREAGVLVEATV